jgi:hypothetical protein
MDVLLVLAVLAVVLLLIVAPLRVGRTPPHSAGESSERAELEAAKEAKYREIRDAELDHRTGKLSHDDWKALDSSLRAEAIELLRRVDELTEQERARGH